MTEEASGSQPEAGESRTGGATAGRAAVLLGVPGLLVVYFAYAAAGIAAGAGALVALLCLALVSVVLRDGKSVERRTADRVTMAALLLLPAALTVCLSFLRGGYFPDGTAFAALVLAAALVVRNALAARPFEGLSRQASVAGAALGLLAGWTLLSGLWSESVERALVEFDRVLVYGLALVLFASFPKRMRDLRWMVRGLALGIAAVCVIALITRTLPHVWPTTPGFAESRLSFPLGYWNALGLLAGIGLILCLHLGSSEDEPWVARVLGCAACPLLAATLLLTFSRGAIAATALGLLVYALAGRPRALLTGLVASAPAVVVALVLTYHADLLASDQLRTAAAIVQGKHLALGLVLCAACAAAIRAILLPVDAWLARLRLSAALRRSAVALAVIAGIFLVAATGVPNRLANEYDRFVSGAPNRAAPQVRDRLTDGSSSGRIDLWSVARRAFDRAPVTGQGAGTYELLFATEGLLDLGQVRDAHSLYAEVAGELGLVGLVLVVVAIGAILLAAALGARGPDRAVHGAVFAAGLAWAVHAGFDWDWEMSATGLWLFALGGAVLAKGGTSKPPSRETRLPARAVVGVLLLVVAAPAALIGVSQARIDDSTVAFGRGDCAAAVKSATMATATLGVRSAPEQILGYCWARRGLKERSLRAMQAAIEDDPKSSGAHYGLAVVRAAAGLDPRSAAREAARLDPLDPIVGDAVRTFATDSPRAWKRGAMEAPLYLSPEGPFVDFSELRVR